MPGFLRSPQISQRQHRGVPRLAQQLEGDHRVGGEHQQRGIGDVGGTAASAGAIAAWTTGSPAATSRLQAREKGRQTRPRRFHRTWE